MYNKQSYQAENFNHRNSIANVEEVINVFIYQSLFPHMFQIHNLKQDKLKRGITVIDIANDKVDRKVSVLVSLPQSLRLYQTLFSSNKISTTTLMSPHPTVAMK